jgi:hypothetical protein
LVRRTAVQSPAIAFRRGWNYVMTELTLEPDSIGGENQKKRKNNNKIDIQLSKS